MQLFNNAKKNNLLFSALMLGENRYHRDSIGLIQKFLGHVPIL